MFISTLMTLAVILSQAQINTPDAAALPNKQALVGAIRWDAWHGQESNVGLTVEKTLAPKHWHYRLPFFAKVISDNQVEVRGNTQEIMDQEIMFAHHAGLDYWAFVVYPEDNPLSLGLKQYLSSENKSRIRFCLNLQGGWEGQGGPDAWPKKVERYMRYFQEPTYQTVLEERPLVFLYSVEGLVSPGNFQDWKAAREAFDALRAATVAAGMKTPYIVAQGWAPETLKEQVGLLGLDAIGAYASSAGAKAGTYADLARHTEQWWDAFRAVGLPVVPLASAGWDMRPRIETPTPWVKGGNIEEFYAPATPPELVEHVTNAIQWCKAHPETAQAQAILIYAWNEFDEGGWLCPTLAEGAARLDALRAALRLDQPEE